jgi:peptidoglycan-N-acetylglucosamine deacetylase
LACFFIPGWVAEHHTDRCKQIMEAGFEIGHHGYSHEWADPKHPGKECVDFDRGARVLDRLLGCKPHGYRPPGAEITANTIRMLADRGYLYNSNMLDDVYRAHRPTGRRERRIIGH